jgi:TusA-related sulfurtransferase
MADQTLDAKGLNCPLPILKARKALKDVPAGGTLEILATDPGGINPWTHRAPIVESASRQTRTKLRPRNRNAEDTGVAEETRNSRAV